MSDVESAQATAVGRTDNGGGVGAELSASASVEAALGELEALRDTPLSVQADMFDRIHEQLRRALADVDET